ncbi:MAG: hypothetical protein V9H69_21880 [Anaerolineae bacterium]
MTRPSPSRAAMASALDRPGRPMLSSIGRRQGLQAEFDAGVAHAGGAVGVDLEIAVVGGGQGGDAALHQVVQQRPRQG